VINKVIAFNNKVLDFGASNIFQVGFNSFSRVPITKIIFSAKFWKNERSFDSISTLIKIDINAENVAFASCNFLDTEATRYCSEF
jgi:hypothetical protein